jgi:DNA-binding transcriptional MerR regulator
MSQATFSIGEIASRTGCKVQTIRWYEEIGLIPAPARTAGGHRSYRRGHLERLDFIRHARELGFPLDAVRSLLSLATASDQGSCETAHQMAAEQLNRVERKLRRLEALRKELARMVKTGCRGSPAECRILATLADHGHAHCIDATHAIPARV